MERFRTLLRYVRIATTAFFVVLCVLLIALWVRSRSRVDSVSLTTDSHIVHMDSMFGRLRVSHHHPTQGRYNFAPGVQRGWLIHTDSNKGWVDAKPDYLAFGFGWKTYGNGVGIFIPYWFPVLLTATLAVLPWIKWRLSLRTLLIGMTLVAVGLGIIVATM